MGHSEVAPAKERGKFVTMNHVGFIAGLATGLWYVYAMPKSCYNMKKKKKKN